MTFIYHIRRTMKSILIDILLLNVIICFSISADIAGVDYKKIIGSWINNNFYYSFDSEGIMKKIINDSEPVSYDTYKYDIIAMGNHEFIRYGKNLSDSISISLLYLSDITDSTAMFGYGMTFVKADTTNGLLGLWKHVDGLSYIYWNIGLSTIDYTQSVLNLNTGGFETVEEHHGTYIRGHGRYDAGRFFIDFQDGKKAVVIPIFYKDIMYMFDISPRKSIFTLTESAPKYLDYKKSSN